MGLSDFIIRATKIMESTLIPLAFTLCLFYFSWGVAKYIKNSDSKDAAAQAKNVMVWGLAGIFVLVAIWGIVKLIGSELQIPNYDKVRIN